MSDPPHHTDAPAARDTESGPPTDPAMAVPSSRLRTVISIADFLMSCDSVDAVCRQAVELARGRLGVERCAVFLMFGDDLKGTWGTDRFGATVAEHPVSSPASEFWGSMDDFTDAGGPRWQVREHAEHLAWAEDHYDFLGHGWIAATPLRTPGRLVGIIYNDTAISGLPLDPTTQELLAVLGTLLGTIVVQKRAKAEADYAREEERALGEDLEAVIDIADSLMSISDTDTLCRQAVELAREKLAVERCSIHLFRGNRMYGTWGTDMSGTTTDEHAPETPLQDKWLAGLVGHKSHEAHWAVEEMPRKEWRDGTWHELEPGWVAGTLIRSSDRELGIFFNDAAITRTPISPEKQEVLAVYCSMLGSLMERIESEQAEKRLSEGMRNVVSLSEQLMACETVDDLFRRAVELGRSDLGLVRCGIDIVDGEMLRGTWGINRHGELVDEHAKAVLLVDALGPKRHVTRKGIGQRWEVLRSASLADWDGNRSVPFARGWVVSTPIQSHEELHGLFFNDGAGACDGPNGVTQEILAVFCTTLGSILRRKRAEEAERRLSEGLRTSFRLSRQLMRCPDVQELFRMVIDHALTHFGFDRCGIHVVDGDMMRGTWGTNLQGEIVDERHLTFPVSDSVVSTDPVETGAGGRIWELHEDVPQSEWNGEEYVVTGRGWLGVTRIQMPGRLYGLCFTDGAITGRPPDRTAHEILAVHCSLAASILERIEANERTLHAERVATVGSLVGGVAHEFRNLSSVVLGNLDMLLHRIEPNSPLRRHAMLAMEAVSRSVSTADGLLAFARKRRTEKENVAVSQIVDDAVQLVSRELRDNGIDLSVEFDHTATVRADAILIGQVLINLLLNAERALEDVERKIIRVTSGITDSRVFIRVRDNGCGIAEEDLERVFEPFHTSRGDDETPGTGLGLSVGRTIVEDHDGSIDVESVLGEGTTFTVWLPLA